MRVKDNENYRKKRLKIIQYLREEEGETCKDIAGIFYVSLPTISQLCRRYGFKRNANAVRRVEEYRRNNK